MEGTFASCSCVHFCMTFVDLETDFVSRYYIARKFTLYHDDICCANASLMQRIGTEKLNACSYV